MSDLDHSIKPESSLATSADRAAGGRTQGMIAPIGGPTIGPTIGLTGGIAMGKTALSTYLHQAYGLPVLDADLYARAAVAPGTAVLEAIVQRYGPSLRQPDGSLERSKLGAIVFADPAERQWLEQQIHPQVRRHMQADAAQRRAAQPDVPILMVIPLLFEAQLTDWVSEIWVICCPQTQQLQRLIAREALTEVQAMARIGAQLPIGQKCDRADVVIPNVGTVAELAAAADRAMNQRFPDWPKRSEASFGGHP
jgi:dephospho-CoA kinase